MINGISGFLDLILIIQSCLIIFNYRRLFKLPFYFASDYCLILIFNITKLNNEFKAALYCLMRTTFFNCPKGTFTLSTSVGGGGGSRLHFSSNFDELLHEGLNFVALISLLSKMGNKYSPPPFIWVPSPPLPLFFTT